MFRSRNAGTKSPAASCLGLPNVTDVLSSSSLHGRYVMLLHRMRWLQMTPKVAELCKYNMKSCVDSLVASVSASPITPDRYKCDKPGCSQSAKVVQSGVEATGLLSKDDLVCHFIVTGLCRAFPVVHHFVFARAPFIRTRRYSSSSTIPSTNRTSEFDFTNTLTCGDLTGEVLSVLEAIHESRTFFLTTTYYCMSCARSQVARNLLCIACFAPFLPCVFIFLPACNTMLPAVELSLALPIVAGNNPATRRYCTAFPNRLRSTAHSLIDRNISCT